MQQTKDDELVEQRERSLRERNFIIHGLPEENSSDKTANSDTNDHGHECSKICHQTW